jgi:hypothetical protein
MLAELLEDLGDLGILEQTARLGLGPQLGRPRSRRLRKRGLTSSSAFRSSAVTPSD